MRTISRKIRFVSTTAGAYPSMSRVITTATSLLDLIKLITTSCGACLTDRPLIEISISFFWSPAKSAGDSGAIESTTGGFSPA